ncbi:SecY-interacting protein [Pseudoalteromonas xiamenensis]
MSETLLLQQTLNQFNQLHPTTFHDDAWPSPCEIGSVLDDEQIAWRPVAREGESLNALAKALEVQFPIALHQFYSEFFAPNIQAAFEGHSIELIQPWSKDDFKRLQENITGHVLMKRRLKQPETVFIGLTEQDDVLITVELATGNVCLEQLGKKPHHILASSLEAFVELLSII